MCLEATMADIAKLLSPNDFSMFKEVLQFLFAEHIDRLGVGPVSNPVLIHQEYAIYNISFSLRFASLPCRYA
jgi:hypothetical protein